MTTIEMYEKKKTLPWRYDLGHRRNFQAGPGHYAVHPLQFKKLRGESCESCETYVTNFGGLTTQEGTETGWSGVGRKIGIPNLPAPV